MRALPGLAGIALLDGPGVAFFWNYTEFYDVGPGKAADQSVR